MKINKGILTACFCAVIFVGITFGSEVKKGTLAKIQNTNLGYSESDISKGTSKTITDNSSGSDSSNTDIDSKQTYSSDSVDKNMGKSSSSKYKDGTYIGTAPAYNGNIKVSVVVSAGKIDSIDIIESGDDEAYLSKARGVINNIISNQNTDVQIVSGATYSSSGIINAVMEALASGGAQ